MIAEFKKNVNLYVGGGIILTLIGANARGYTMGPLFLLVGEIMYMYGLYFYAKAKGYSGWLCLLGLLSLIGLIILVLLPDHRKQG